MILRAMDLEHRLLAACAIAPGDLDLSETFARAAGSIAWPRLAASAAANQLRPQLARHLEPIRVRIPQAAEIVRELEAFMDVQRGHALMLSGELLRVLAALRREGIAAMAFKGPAFAALEGDGPASREMGDLDIVVAPRDIAASARALAALGYQPPVAAGALDSPWIARIAHELPLRRAADAMLVELHWRFAPRWHPSPLRFADLESRQVTRSFVGEAIAWPRPEALLLMHVADGMKSGGRGLRWLGDVARIVRRHPDLDWGEVRAIAAAAGGSATLSMTLALLRGAGRELAAGLGEARLALALPAEDGIFRESMPLLTAMVERIAHDRRLDGAGGHFAWAWAISDRPWRTALHVAGYLTGPSMADLRPELELPRSDLALRARALRRRLGSAFAPPARQARDR